MKKYLYTAVFAFMLVSLSVAPSSAYAQSTYTSAQLRAQLDTLLLRVADLRAQLYTKNTIPSYQYDNCTYYDSRYCTNQHNIDRIEVDFVGRIAQVTVEFDNYRDDRHYALYADTIRQVAQALSLELGIPTLTIEQLIDENYRYDGSRNDFRSIDVEFFDRDASVTIRFRNGDTDRFTLRNVNERENRVIEIIASRYDERERDIKDVIDFDFKDNDDFRSIAVNFYRDDAQVTVRFRNSDTERFTIRNVDYDKDEVIEYLADRYNVRERVIEDVINFD